MSRTEPAATAYGVDRALQMPSDWWLASWSNAIESQRLWLAAMLPWQQALVAAQRDLWDRWMCRCAGGVPIDA